MLLLPPLEKKVAGRKRQVLVDTLGNLLAVLVHSAGWSDAQGGAWLLCERTLHLTRLLLIWADQAYRGDLVDDARELLDLDLAIVERPPDARGFTLLPRRWVVERSLGWFNRNRRLSKDYEKRPEVSEALIYIASIHRMLKHLRPNSRARRPYSGRAA
ncbi:MAG: transposase [Chloroflexota bacterium]|nr:transposase [Chloroflexota bacterium]